MYITKHLITVLLENVILFSLTVRCVPQARLRKHQDPIWLENKTYYFPRTSNYIDINLTLTNCNMVLTRWTLQHARSVSSLLDHSWREELDEMLKAWNFGTYSGNPMLTTLKSSDKTINVCHYFDSLDVDDETGQRKSWPFLTILCSCK